MIELSVAGRHCWCALLDVRNPGNLFRYLQRKRREAGQGARSLRQPAHHWSTISYNHDYLMAKQPTNMWLAYCKSESETRT